MKNQLLQATQEKIEGNLWGQNKADVEKVVIAGMRAALAKGPEGIAASLRNSKDPIHDSVVGAINLAIILRKQSRNTMPVKALVPGATILMLKALDFAEAMGVVQIDKPELEQATHLLVNTLFKRLGITSQMLHHAAGNVKALVQNPVSVERLKLAAGMTKHPNAPEPTPLTDDGMEDEEEDK